MTNEAGRRFQTAVEKDRARDGFKHVGKQGVLLTAPALFFTASEPQKLTDIDALKSGREV